MDKSWSGDSAQLLQEIDWKMSRIESILQQVSVDGLIEEAYEIHEMLLKVSQLLLILQQDLKMTPLAKGLSLQLQSIQEQYNRLFSKGEIPKNFLNNQTIKERRLMRRLSFIVPKYGVYPTVPYW
ncbi:hypothetical protein Q8G37_24925 [Bacillus wiedmannii]|uniref:hypothetical protein n=2 Tax=Bacillus wiedmannii TaxID=1890302 RepID=UPI0027310769|nr:hypothetical protein [Bacillus wiedmannii]MDP1459653.1 hypothetical protein [Bacillus wiedmannii]